MRLLEAQVQDLKTRLPQAAAAMTVRVKICGINDPAAIRYRRSVAGADWVGFDFFPPSPRYVTPSLAADLSARCAGWTAARRAVRRSDAGRHRRGARYGAAGRPAALRRGGPGGTAFPLRPADVARCRHDDRRRSAGRSQRAPTGCCWRPSRRPARRGQAATPPASIGRCCAAGRRRRLGCWPAA